MELAPAIVWLQITRQARYKGERAALAFEHAVVRIRNDSAQAGDLILRSPRLQTCRDLIWEGNARMIRYPDRRTKPAYGLEACCQTPLRRRASGGGDNTPNCCPSG